MAKEELTQEQIAQFLESSPFIRFSGMQLKQVDYENLSITITMPSRPDLLRSDEGDMFHGGPVAALIDIAGDFAVILVSHGPVPTINFRTDYLRPATGGELKAIATVRRFGRLVTVADVEVFDSEGRLCAVGRGTYSSSVG